MKELKDIALKKGDIIYFADNSWYIVRQCENSESVEKVILSYMTVNKITKIERPLKYETIYEAPKQILDKEEKEYLKAVIRPFKDRVDSIVKRSPVFDNFKNKEYIVIGFDSTLGSCLPNFEAGTRYKGMELNKKYTLKELGLFEE